MNIKQAKQEIEHTLKAYHRKDDRGNYVFPVVRQRPILLMGPPGIGKTAILEQVARECGVGLVAYSLTHHTRQSAVGLPHIENVEWDGKTMSVTRYTMSEIIASVYEYMEKTGKREGILFLDEVNCVSETLAPTMLQLLQNKTFGSHRVPEGWILVTAGNPPEYNKSVREFDVATLDRVRTLNVEADCGVWLEYARARGVHGAILSYLAIRPEDFYLVEDKPEGKFFVTARGWEDLSELLKGYEDLDVPVTKELVGEYLRKDEVAASFAAYYGLYRKYGQDYGIPEILAGNSEIREQKVEMAKKGGFEERFTVIGLLLDALDFRGWAEQRSRLHVLQGTLKRLKLNWGEGPGVQARKNRESRKIRLEAGLLESGQEKTEAWVDDTLERWDGILKQEHLWEPEPGFERIRGLFAQKVEHYHRRTDDLSRDLENAFRFAEDCFGEGQELVLLVAELSRSGDAMAFISANGSEAFLRHSGILDFRRQEEALMEECRQLME